MVSDFWLGKHKSTAETAMEAECLRNGKIFSCMDQEGHLKGDIAYR